MDKDLQSRYLYDAIIMFRKERTKNIRTSHPERCQGLDAAPASTRKIILQVTGTQGDSNVRDICV